MRCCRTDSAPMADAAAAARSLPSISRHHWDQRNPNWRDTIRHCCRYLYQPPGVGPWFDVSCGNARTCHCQSRKFIFSQISRAVACERRRVQDANKTDVSAEQRQPTEYVSTRTFCPCSHHAYTFASKKCNFYPRDAMLARVIAMAVCLLSVSVTSQSSIEADERIELILARELPFDLSYTVLEGNSGISKNIDLYLCRLWNAQRGCVQAHKLWQTKLTPNPYRLL